MTGKRVFLLGAGLRILTGRVETFSTFEFILILRDEHRDESRCGTLRACATIQVQRINRVRRGLGPSALRAMRV